MPTRRKEPKQPSADWRETPEFQAFSAVLGRNVRAYRKARGLTLEKASEAMDVDLRHLAKIEAGTLNPTLVTLWRVAKGLGVTVPELFLSPLEPPAERG